MTTTIDVASLGVGYTIATGRLYCSMEDLQRTAENLLMRSVWTHEFADPNLWTLLRRALEDTAKEEVMPS